MSSLANPNLTLEEIARLSGVSRSTVSRVINEQPNVSEDVRKRVLAVIEETGYQPNLAAQTLVSKRSWMIGLVLPRTVSAFFTDPYFPRLTQGIAQACNQYDYTLGLFLVGTKEDEEKIFPRVSRKGMLDGVLIQSGQIGDRLIDSMTDLNLPVVVLGSPLHSAEVSFIDVDNASGAYNAVSHLIRLGYQHIGTITGLTDSAAGADRLKGYKKALIERGRNIEQAYIVEGDFTEAGGYYAMQQLLPAKPDAVFAASDLMANGAMRAAREAGLSIPKDIALVGFDDVPIATYADPQLTTIRQPIARLGFNAVEILIDLIENGIRPNRRIIMDTELIIRDSCGASRRK
ncbi:MAG: LacI family DNA-binding transcriptional regulator [Anaerolineales bacterium]